MALFNQSTMVWATAVETIADSAGASADAEMRVRAHKSLRAAFQFLGGKHRWDFLRSEAGPISITGPFTVTGVSASSGQVSAAVPTNHGFKTDDLVLGDGFIRNMRITATATNGIGLSTAISGLAVGVNVITATGIRDFYDLPSDTRGLYSVRLLSNGEALRYVGRRLYDRTVVNEDSVTTPPSHYDLFSFGGKGKIRLLPPPGGGGDLQVRYLRRMFLATASAATTALDIPEDYEEVPIAWAKWHFLTDKGEGRNTQAGTWLALAEDGIKMMLKEQSNLQDDDLVIVPGHTMGFPNINSTRWLDFDYT